jgi:hypothetical protein
MHPHATYLPIIQTNKLTNKRQTNNIKHETQTKAKQKPKTKTIPNSTVKMFAILVEQGITANLLEAARLAITKEQIISSYTS